jgi:hypothetical protein
MEFVSRWGWSPESALASARGAERSWPGEISCLGLDLARAIVPVAFPGLIRSNSAARPGSPPSGVPGQQSTTCWLAGGHPVPERRPQTAPRAIGDVSGRCGSSPRLRALVDRGIAWLMACVKITVE